jgi:hypothetical protein
MLGYKMSIYFNDKMLPPKITIKKENRTSQILAFQTVFISTFFFGGGGHFTVSLYFKSGEIPFFKRQI